MVSVTSQNPLFHLYMDFCECSFRFSGKKRAEHGAFREIHRLTLLRCATEIAAGRTQNAKRASWRFTSLSPSPCVDSLEKWRGLFARKDNKAAHERRVPKRWRVLQSPCSVRLCKQMAFRIQLLPYTMTENISPPGFTWFKFKRKFGFLIGWVNKKPLKKFASTCNHSFKMINDLSYK